MRLRVNTKRIAIKQAFLFFAAAVVAFSSLSLHSFVEEDAAAASTAKQYYAKDTTFDVPAHEGEVEENRLGAIANDQRGNTYVATNKYSSLFVDVFNAQNDHIRTHEVTQCESTYPAESMFINDMTINDNGMLFVLMNSRSPEIVRDCAKVYNSDGVYQREVALDEGGFPPAVNSRVYRTLAVAPNGNIYVGEDLYKHVRVFSPSGEKLFQFGGPTDEPGGLGEAWSPRSVVGNLQVFNNKIYVNNASRDLIQVYNLDGTYISQKSTLRSGSESYVNAFHITANNELILVYGTEARVVKFNNYNDTAPAYSYIMRNEINNPLAVEYAAVGLNQKIFVQSNTFNDQQLTVRTYKPTMVSAVPEGIRISMNQPSSTSFYAYWYTVSGEVSDVLVEYVYQLKDSAGAVLKQGSTESNELSITDILFDDGEEYTLHIIPQNIVGQAPESRIRFTTEGQVFLPGKVESFTYKMLGDKQYVVLEGQRLFPDNAYGQWLTRSLVSFEGRPLAACAESFGPEATAEVLRSQYQPGYVEGETYNAFTDDEPCIFLQNTEAGELYFGEDKIAILLPAGYEVGTNSTVLLNDSITYTLQPPTETNPGTPIVVAPTVTADNGLSLASNPIISSQPVFSGNATPGAYITIEVRSDPVFCATYATVDGTWSCKLPQALPVGNHTVRAAVTEPTAEDVNVLGPFAVRVADDSTPLEPEQPGTSPVVESGNAGGTSQNTNTDRVSASSTRSDSSTIAFNQFAQAAEEVPQTIAPSEDPLAVTDSTDTEPVLDDAIADAEQEMHTNWLWVILGGAAAVGAVIYLITKRRGSRQS